MIRTLHRPTAPAHRLRRVLGIPASWLRLTAPLLLTTLLAAVLLLAAAGCLFAGEPDDPGDPDGPGRAATHSLPLKIVPQGVEEVHLEPVDPADPDAGYRYVVEYADGHTERLSPDRFAELLYTEFYGNNRLFALFNITSPIGVAWVGLGFLGQILFTGRMLVQWLASERRRRSVVPTAFWWMSLGGATMLIVYFVWRKDIVGVLGQATGWLIYLRNLRLIYRSSAEETPAVPR